MDTNNIHEQLWLHHSAAKTDKQKKQFITCFIKMLKIIQNRYEWCYCEAVTNDLHQNKWSEWKEKAEEINSYIESTIYIIKNDVDTCFKSLPDRFEFVKDQLKVSQDTKDLFQSKTVFTLEIEITNNSGDFKNVLNKITRLINGGMVNDSDSYDDSQYTFRIAEDY
jgi:hypothetical protein